MKGEIVRSFHDFEVTNLLKTELETQKTVTPEKRIKIVLKFPFKLFYKKICEFYYISKLQIKFREENFKKIVNVKN